MNTSTIVSDSDSETRIEYSIPPVIAELVRSTLELGRVIVSFFPGRPQATGFWFERLSDQTESVIEVSRVSRIKSKLQLLGVNCKTDCNHRHREFWATKITRKGSHVHYAFQSRQGGACGNGDGHFDCSCRDCRASGDFKDESFGLANRFCWVRIDKHDVFSATGKWRQLNFEELEKLLLWLRRNGRFDAASNSN